MWRRAAAARGEVELSRSCLGQFDQLLQRARGQRGMNDDEKRRGDELADRREGPERLEARIRVETGRYAERGGGREEQRVAVRRQLRRGCGAYRAARARSIVHEHLLAQRRREMLGDGAADGVGGSAWSERHDQADGLCRPGLREPVGLPENAGQAERDCQRREPCQ